MAVRAFARIAAVGAVLSLAAVLASCGGGDDGGGGDLFDGTTVRSDDGVLTVEVPAGAAADGVEVTITALSEEGLPSELQGADAVVVGYELDPDGAEFSEPVLVTFRVSPSNHELDLPDEAVPLGLLLTQNAAGELESIEGAEVSREDGDVVVRAGLAHFSSAIVVLSDRRALVLRPSEAELEVGERFNAQVSMRDLSTGEDLGVVDFSELYTGDFIGLSEWEVVTPFVVESFDSEGHRAQISCTARTDGWVPGAYQVVIPPGRSAAELVALAIVGGTNLFRQNTGELAGFKLAGDGKCNGDEETATPEASSTSSGGGNDRSSADSQYDIEGAGTSGSVAVNGEDCFGYEGPKECALEMDITGFAWEPVEGEPGLVKFTLKLAGPLPPSPGPFYIQMTATGTAGTGSDAPRVTTRIIVRDGLLCEGFGSPNVLPESGPGESCGSSEAGTYEIVRDLSELAGEVTVNVLSAGAPTDGGEGPEDMVTIRGIEVVR